MKPSKAVRASVLIALIAEIAVTEATRERITVKNHGVKFKVDWWDDGRAYPYRVWFTKNLVSSKYTFDAAGRLAQLYVDEAGYTFSTDTGEVQPVSDRMLLSGQQETQADETEMEMEMEMEHRRLYDCPDCEQTWDTMCDIGLEDVCYWANEEVDLFNDDTVTSLNKMCIKFTKECTTSAETTCQGMCTEVLPEATPAPTPAPQEPAGACNPNPCQNGGSCSSDPAGGHMCSCAPNYGGMACQIETSSLAPFYIVIDYIGTWTEERMEVFQSAADKWAEVITHVPCGGNNANPAGSLTISSTLEGIDGVGGTLGSAGPTSYWSSCKTVSLTGAMRFDIDDIASMEEDGTFEGVILHEMGHVIGIGTLWGDIYSDCSTCRADGNPAWHCPAAVSAYADIGGSDANILELDGSSGTSCGHLDETIFNDELMTGWVDNVMHLSKITAAILDDLDYIVDPSAVDSYTLPTEGGLTAATIVHGSSSSLIPVVDVAVETIILAVDGDGRVVEETVGVVMEF